MSQISVKNVKNNKFYQFISSVMIILTLGVILFFIVVQSNFKNKYLDNLSGWCEKYSGTWTRVYEDGRRVKLTSDVDEHEEPGKDIVLETKLPMNLKEDSIFCMVLGRNTWFYVGDELRGVYLDSDCPFPGGLVKNRIVQIKLGLEDSGKTLRIVRNDKVDNHIVISEAYIGNSYGIYDMFYNRNGLQMNASILLVVMSTISLIVVLSLSARYKNSNNVIFLCLGIFMLGLWLMFDNYLYQYLFGTYFIDGIMTYLIIMLAPFFFIHYLNKEQKNRYSKLYSFLNVILLIDFVVFSVLHFTSLYNFADSMLYMNIVLSCVITGISYTIIHDFSIGKIKEYKYIAIGLFALAISGIFEIIYLNVNQNGNLDGLFSIIGMYILLIMAIIHMIRQSESIRDKAMDAMRANKLKSNFLANMSHEIRTPINAIVGMNEMILMEKINDNVKEYSYNIKSASKSLLSIVNDILDFSVIETGKVIIKEETYNTSSIVNDIIVMTSMKADEKGLKFIYNIDSKLPRKMLGDENRIKQVIINLLTNAVKYTDKGHVELVLSGKIVDDTYMLKAEVKDTGIGIREEDKHKLFKKFERLNNNSEGTGLGLAISGHLVEQMKGSIKVDSEFGKGSTFTVVIPQTIVDKTAMSDYRIQFQKDMDETNVATKFTVGDVKILVVDDNYMNLQVTTGLLKNSGIKVDTCDSANKMFECIVKEKYDLILLDHMMPEIDGVEALGIMKEMKDNLCKDTPVVAMTANAIVGVKEKYLKAGFDDYLSKPVSGKALENIISKYVQNELIGYAGSVDEEIVELKEIPEFDTDYAMRLIGDEGIFRELLEDYADYIKNLDNKLEIARKDIKEYGILVHSIKSSSANVGALTISRLARLLEIAAFNEDEKRIDRLHPVLIEELKNHYDILSSVIEMKENNLIEVDSDEVLVELNAIIDCLKKYDYSSCDNHMDALNRYAFIGEKQELVDRIKAYIDEFEPEAAIESIEELITILKQ